MDLRDIFRSFFGINGRNDDNFWKRDSFFDTNENNDSFDYEMNRNFEDMFRSFGQMFNIFNNFPIFGDKDMIEFIDSNGIEESTNPRNLMLRESENEKKGFDFDYDQTVRQNGLNSLIDNKSDNRLTQKEPQIISKSYFYSSTFNNGVFFSSSF
jgi:PhoPQ-activated pathogenicity-related protein